MAAIGVSAATLLFASYARAWVDYPAAQTLSEAGQHAFAPAVVAIDSQDRATVAWSRSDGTSLRIQAVRLGADGTPGAVQTLSDPGQDAARPQVAIDSQGRATLAWQRSDGADLRIQAVRLGADGTPGAVQTLSGAGEEARVRDIAVDSQGRATVVWRRSDGTNTRIQAVRLGADGTPGAIHTLSDAGQDTGFAAVAIDSQDRATVVWDRFDGTNQRIQAVRLAADGTPGAVQTLSEAGQDAFDTQVAVDSQDRATVVWTRSDGTDVRVQAVRLAADETPGAIRTLSPAGQDGDLPHLALDPQDRATVVWTRSDGTNSRIEAVRLGADGAPETVRTVSDAGQHATRTEVAVDSQGRATVVWQRSDGTNFRIQAVRLNADGAPEAVQTLSDEGQDGSDAQVAVDSQGRTTVVWQRSDGTNLRIQSARGTPLPPDTRIDSGPADGETIASSSPSFAFSGIPAAGVDHFECSVDSGAFAACTSPQVLGPLADGVHAFAVRAVDPDGADPSPAQRAFTVDTTPDDGPADVLPPGLTLTGKKAQRLGKAVKVKVACDEPCATLATGKLRIRKGGRRMTAAPKSLKLKSARAELSAGESATLKLKLKPKGRRIAKRALRRGRKVVAGLAVGATDAAGNATAQRRTVRLKLR